MKYEPTPAMVKELIKRHKAQQSITNGSTYEHHVVRENYWILYEGQVK